ncbi:putative kinase [Yasminevirus sp. GU-2018]|uniref:Putative kinase n=1 Tax=Yasminevirus sp. GU-2018 TaxID=2420051 RepID=A0A5K0UAY8_9VIRU|nr:putative kinase [Yasminevirus sp. GU-2018]
MCSQEYSGDYKNQYSRKKYDYYELVNHDMVGGSLFSKLFAKDTDKACSNFKEYVKIDVNSFENIKEIVVPIPKNNMTDNSSNRTTSNKYAYSIADPYDEEVDTKTSKMVTFVLKLLGEGSFGAVYKLMTKGTLKDGKTDVVIKIFKDATSLYTTNIYEKYRDMRKNGVDTITPCGLCRFEKKKVDPSDAEKVTIETKYGFFMKNVGDKATDIYPVVREDRDAILKGLLRFVDTIENLNKHYIHNDLKIDNVAMRYDTSNEDLQITLIDLDDAVSRNELFSDLKKQFSYTITTSGVDRFLVRNEASARRIFGTNMSFNYIGMLNIFAFFLTSCRWSTFCKNLSELFSDEHSVDSLINDACDQVYKIDLSKIKYPNLPEEELRQLKEKHRYEYEKTRCMIRMQFVLTDKKDKYMVGEQQINTKLGSIANRKKDFISKIEGVVSRNIKSKYKRSVTDFTDLLVGMCQVDTGDRMDWKQIKNLLAKIIAE